MFKARIVSIFVGFCLSTGAFAQLQRPNFIVVMADDLGFGDLGIYGSTLIQTPNLDRMAAEGIYFDSFYASANVCTASRGGLLTGRYPVRLDLVMLLAQRMKSTWQNLKSPLLKR